MAHTRCLSLPLALLLAVGALCVGARTVYPSGGCDSQKMTVYKVLVETAWDREVFPKQYPEWRPPAQWSKVVGRSHDSTFSLFTLGEDASEGLKKFAEKGDSNMLDAHSQGSGGVLDEFNAPPIPQGVGETSSDFLVDGNHSKVSLISRVVPSPDWFIGVDSFDLCVEGKWVESVVLDLDPLDAGTENGFTFTSPNWPTIPQKPVSRITAQTPDHPANSFYYPDRTGHPPIATVRIFKIKEYELARVYNPSLARSPERRYRTGSIPTTPELEENRDQEVSNEIFPATGLTTPTTTTTTEVPKHALINTIVDKYRKKFRKNRNGRKMATRRRRVRGPRDCRVSEWSEWSSCSKTCGIGDQIRTRTVLRHSRRGGRPCPNLQETQWCGSSRDCDHRYFNW